MKILSYLFTVIFVAFSLVQFNDPDPWLWVTIYLFSAFTSLCSAWNYYNPMLLMILITYYLISSISYFPFGSIEQVINAEETAKSLGMKLPFVEEARESMGLFICFVVNLVLMFIGFKKAKMPNYNLGFFYTGDSKQSTK